MTKTTPLMQQYHTIKAQYSDALLFFQVGDFFELFFDDAKKASAFLGIALTKRGKDKGNDIPLCGVPVHSLEHHLHKLVKGGFCVVICEQLEPAQPGVMVKRGVTKVLTPGMLTDENLLDEKSASYLLSFVQLHNKWTLLFGELLTAQLYATTFDVGLNKTLETELARFFPDEIIVAHDEEAQSQVVQFKKQGYFTQVIQPSDQTHTQQWTQKHLQASLQQVLTSNASLEKALAVFHAYVQKNNQTALQEFSHLHLYEPEDFMMLDGATQKNLELVCNAQNGSRKNTLFALLDKAVTAMGSRTLKKWLVRPLVQKTLIEHRQEAVAYFVQHYSQRQFLQTKLRLIGDLERIVGRIALSRAGIQDYIHLVYALAVIPEIAVEMVKTETVLLSLLQSYCVDLIELRDFLESALHDDAAHEWKIKTGFNAELDKYRDLVINSQKALLALEKQEQEVTGITSLKIRFNAIQGYYIEVTNANLKAVPERYVRRQTLVGKERFTCPELQALQHDIMHARSVMEQLEHTLFQQVKDYVYPYVGRLRKIAHALGQLDVLLSFATCAYERGYVRPVITEGRDIHIVQGKHPVIEHNLGAVFIANDTHLDDTQSLLIITGPNMGGKSTYLRQVAHMSIMAQCGSFIPAQEASLPLIDRIFTRIGASDNVAEGKSTFLVEMEETAHICQYATQRSLVILDEVGRGTSTFDGLALAQAVIEYIYTHIKARCLFATHYHELTRLPEQFSGIANFYAVSKKTPDGILFLHTIAPGAAQSSFGLEVAALAHIPTVVVARARTILQELTEHTVYGDSASSASSVVTDIQTYQMTIDKLNKQIHQLQKKIAELDALDVNELSPKQAFDVIWKFKQP